MFGKRKRTRSVEVDSQGTVPCTFCGERSRLISTDRCVLGHRVIVNNLDTHVEEPAAHDEESEMLPAAVAYQRLGLFGGLADESAPAQPSYPPAPVARPTAPDQPAEAEPSRQAAPVAQPAAPAAPAEAQPTQQAAPVAQPAAPVLPAAAAIPVAQPARPSSPADRRTVEPAAAATESTERRAAEGEGDDWSFEELFTWDSDVVAPSSLDV